MEPKVLTAIDLKCFQSPSNGRTEPELTPAQYKIAGYRCYALSSAGLDWLIDAKCHRKRIQNTIRVTTSLNHIAKYVAIGLGIQRTAREELSHWAIDDQSDKWLRLRRNSCCQCHFFKGGYCCCGHWRNFGEFKCAMAWAVLRAIDAKMYKVPEAF